MGIMRLIKNLITRYPLIHGNIKKVSDISAIDNLYLDLNSIIHECAHSSTENILSLLKEKTNEEIYFEVCEFINQIVEFVNPQSLIMIALDGVNPLAKINGQLSSRHIKSFERSEEIENFLHHELNFEKINYFDQNKISPSTDFMINLEDYINKFIKQKLESSQFWEGKKIIFSGTNVPGEGEYKIMEKIRAEKQSENKKNLKYCIFSQDSDFILLSLLIHEPNIILLTRNYSGKKNYNFEFSKENNFLLFSEIIYISVLREYLDIEFKELNEKIKNKNLNNNMERFYDDFVLICLILGNDFLPGLILLDINGEVFEFLLKSYKNYIENSGDYLSNNGKINFQNFEIFINELSIYEKEFILIKNKNLERLYYSQKNIKKITLKNLYNEIIINNDNKNLDNKIDNLKNVMNSSEDFTKKLNNIIDQNILSKDKEYDYDLSELFFNKFTESYNKEKYLGQKLYYENKFNFNIDSDEGKNELNKVIVNYLEGLQWILLYYKGFLNWNWNYHYYYSPLISNLAKFNYEENINEDIYQKITKNEGMPLPPYILQCLIFNSFDLIPSNYHKIKEINRNYYDYQIEFDNNGILIPSQMIMKCPIIKDDSFIQKLIEFDKNEFKNTEKYNLIKESYGKEYLYNIKDNYKRKNEILNENNNIKEVDIMFPSIKIIKSYEYLNGYFYRKIKKNKIPIKRFLIYLSNNKNVKKIDDNNINYIIKDYIISYGYPFMKLGIITGLYIKNKYYSIDHEMRSFYSKTNIYDYKEKIVKDYENIGLKFNKISFLVEVVPIINIDNYQNNDIFKFDYDKKYLIPFEITSLNNENKNHGEFLEKTLKKNNIFNPDEVNIDLCQEKLSKIKDIFFFDESKKNKNNEVNKIQKSFKNKNTKKNKKIKFDRKKNNSYVINKRKKNNNKFIDISISIQN